MKTHYIALFMVFALMALNTGCTRKADDSNAKTTQLSFALPSLKAGSGKISQSVSGQSSSLSHVIINITGSKGITYCNWDKHGSSSGPCIFNLPYVTLDVASGSSFIQVLLAFDDQSSNQTSFSYGDVTAAISGSSMSVGITVSSLGGSSSYSADIQGRYFTNSSTSPSGMLTTKIVPVAGKPAMILDQQYVANGWFKTFSISGISMAYGLTDLSTGVETQWFGGNINLNYFVGNATTTPDDSGYAKSASYGTASNARYVSSGTGHYDVMGFFGSPATAVGGTTAYVVTNNSCSANEYTQCLNISSSVKTRFRGVFQKSASGYLQWVSNVLSWTLLNGINSSNLDSVSIYKVTGLSASTINSLRKMNDTFDCNQVATNPNATLISNVTPVSTTSLNVASYPISDPTTEAYFACPIRLGQKLDGVAYPEPWNNMTGSGGTTGPYLRLGNLSTYMGGAVPLTVGKCYSVNFSTYIGSSNPYDVGTTQTITPSASGGSVTFYTTGACTTTTTTYSLTSNVSGSSVSAWFKVTAAAASLTFTATASPATDISFSSDGAFTAAKPVLKFTLPTAMMSNGCYPFTLKTYEADGYTPFSYSSSVNYSTSNTGALYTNSTCVTGSASSASASFSASPTSGTQYIKAPVSVFSGTLTSSDSNFTVVDTNYANMGAGGDLIPVKLAVTVSGSLYAGRCTPVKVSLQNTVNSPVLAQSTYSNIKMYATNGIVTFHADATCGSAPITAASISQDESDTYVFALAHAPAASSVIYADAGAGLSGSLSTPVNTQTLGAYIHPTSLPNFGKATYVGSQEFIDNSGSALMIPFNITAGATIYCSRTSNSSSCSSLFSGSTFVWPVTEATTTPNESYSISINSGGQFASYVFNPQYIWGNSFTVYSCAGNLSSGTALSSGNLPGGTVTCLGSGTYTLSAAATVTGAKIIGKSDKSSVVNITADGEFYVSSGATTTYIANLTINDDQTAATGGRGSIRANSLSTAPINVDNIDINQTLSTSYNVSAFKLTNSSASSNSINNLKVTTVGTTSFPSYGIYIQNSSVIKLTNSSVTNLGSSGYTGLTVYSSTSTSNANGLSDFTYEGTSSGIYLYGTSGSYTSNIPGAVRLNMISHTASALVTQQGYTSFTASDSSFSQDTTQPMIAHSGTANNLTLTRNKFASTADFYAISTVSGSVIPDIIYNQFIKTGGASSSLYPINFTGSTTYTSSVSNTNLTCASSASYGWAGIYTGSGSGTGLTTTVHNGASYVDATSGRCINAN